MRAAVIVAWRPKGFPDWDGRQSEEAALVPAALATDRGAAPYVGIHLASLLPRDWDVTLVHEMVRDPDPEMDVDAVFISTMDYCAPHARRLSLDFSEECHSTGGTPKRCSKRRRKFSVSAISGRSTRTCRSSRSASATASK